MNKLLIVLFLSITATVSYANGHDDYAENNELLAASMIRGQMQQQANGDWIERQMQERKRQYEANESYFQNQETLKEMKRHNRCMECKAGGPDAVCISACM